MAGAGIHPYHQQWPPTGAPPPPSAVSSAPPPHPPPVHHHHPPPPGLADRPPYDEVTTLSFYLCFGSFCDMLLRQAFLMLLRPAFLILFQVEIFLQFACCYLFQFMNMMDVVYVVVVLSIDLIWDIYILTRV